MVLQTKLSPPGVVLGIVITKVLQAADLLKAEFLLNALATGECRGGSSYFHAI